MGFWLKCRDSKGSGVRVKSPATCKNQSGQPTKHREREREREREQKCGARVTGRQRRGVTEKGEKRGKKKRKSITPRYNIYGKSMIYV